MDVNVLVYAHRKDVERHTDYHRWLRMDHHRPRFRPLPRPALAAAATARLNFVLGTYCRTG